jgi:hypothetical protein
LPEAAGAYLLLLRDAGIDESLVKEALDKVQTLPASLPDMLPDTQHVVGKIGWDPRWAEGTVNQIRDIVEHLHESAQVILEVEYARRLNRISVRE